VLDTERHDVTVVNAGHMAPYLRHGKGQVDTIGEEQTGLPLGVVSDYEYEAYTRAIEPGDFLALFTDGFSEAMNSENELYGLERLRDQLANEQTPVTELGKTILEDVKRFVGGRPQSDDMCLACLGRVPS
jgi:sigma-B regulation protein RsbU (phosphoserine phosphatase)